MKLKITKLKGGKEMRTHEMSGEGQLPMLGYPFDLVGVPLDKEANMRMFNTSTVKEILFLADKQGLILDTSSGSRYLLESEEE